MRRLWTIALVALWATPIHGCIGDTSTVDESSGALSAAALDPAVCAPDAGGFTLASNNPYFPLAVGQTSWLEGEEDGEDIFVRIEVLDATEMVAGVQTRVVEEREWEGGLTDDDLVEVSWNYFVEAADGTVCYFGEDVDDYEDGEVVGHEGAWRAGEPSAVPGLLNAPGIIMPAHPKPGIMFQMEDAPEIAEDEGLLVGVGPVEVLGERVTDAIRLRELNPLEGDKGYKVFAPGIGMVVDEELELVAFSP